MRCRVAIFFIVVFCIKAGAQSCCSGGVPVSSNIGFAADSPKVLQLSISADLNYLSSLYDGSMTLDDQLRQRRTQSFLFRGNYAVSSRLSIEWFLPLIRQTRSITLNNGGRDFESTFGLGDPISILNYNITLSPVQWTIGGGIKYPIGSFSERNNAGLFLVEDLQPGSGSLDILLFSALQSTLTSRPSTSLFLRAIYKRNGANPNSRNGLQSYRFGNDIQLIAGISDQVLFLQQILQPSISVRYRSTERDQINDVPNSGTGGNWLFLKGAVSIELSSTASILLQAELPVHTFVNETQLSPDAIINLAFYKSFDFGSKEIIEIF